MAMLHAFDGDVTLSSLRNLVLPGAWAAQTAAERAGIPIRGIDLNVDFAHDELQLSVTYALLTRANMDVRDWKSEIGPRIYRAMRLFHRIPAAKAICVDRRRLVARGEKARKEANRPVRKPQKRRFA